MQTKCFYLVNQFLIICSLYSLTHSKALVGIVEPVQPGQFTYVVSISKVVNSRTTTHYCTGTLISNRDVVTAEHCVANRDISSIKVIVGSSDLREGKKHGVMWYLTYSAWAAQINRPLEFTMNDVAVIRLKRSVRSNIIPAAITTYDNSDFAGQFVEIPSWGVSNNGEPVSIMEKINVSVMSKVDCEIKTSLAADYFLTFEPIIFCTTSDPVSLANRGDSGSPVMLGTMILGITKGTCPFPEVMYHPEKVNVHVGLFYYRTFLLYVIHNLT